MAKKKKQTWPKSCSKLRKHPQGINRKKQHPQQLQRFLTEEDLAQEQKETE